MPLGTRSGAGIICYRARRTARAGQVNLTAGRLSAERDRTSVIKYVQASGQHARNLVHFKHLASSTQRPPRAVTAAVSFEIRPGSPPPAPRFNVPAAAKGALGTLEGPCYLSPALSVIIIIWVVGCFFFFLHLLVVQGGLHAGRRSRAV